MYKIYLNKLINNSKIREISNKLLNHAAINEKDKI